MGTDGIYHPKTKGIRLTAFPEASPPYPAGKTAKKCTYCGCGLNARNRTKDHFVPKCYGGCGAANLVACCCHCNNAKGSLVFRSIDDARTYLKEKKRHGDRMRQLRKLVVPAEHLDFALNEMKLHAAPPETKPIPEPYKPTKGK